MITTDNKLTFDSLRRVPLRKPADAGDAWHGIKHSDLIIALQEACSRRGWSTRGLVALGLSADKADLAAVLLVGITNSPIFQLGILTSNARRYATRLFVGSGTGAIVPFEVFVGRNRHEDIAARLDLALEAVDEYARSLPEVLKRLDSIKISRVSFDAILLRAARESIVPWSRLSIVNEELASYLAPQSFTATEVLRALAQAIAHSPELSQMPKLKQAFDLVTE